MKVQELKEACQLFEKIDQMERSVDRFERLLESKEDVSVKFNIANPTTDLPNDVAISLTEYEKQFVLTYLLDLRRHSLGELKRKMEEL